jgi:curved DNA-binding protein CbpA
MTLTSPAPGSDWYSVLGLSPAASADEIAVAVERLSRQASALAVTAPERSQQLREVTRAIKRDLLSGLESRRRYDQSLRPGAPAAQAPAAPAGMLPAGPPAAGHPAAPPGMLPAGPPAAGHPAAPPGTLPAGPPATGHPAAPTAGPPAAGHPAAPAAGHPAPAAGATAPPAPDRRKRFMRFLQGAWTCPACGHDAMPGEEFCTKCGGRLRTAAGDDLPAGPGSAGARVPSCTACGAALGTDDRFCTHCGSRRE